ncbi:MAG TPA: spore coat protein U domain-containing protein [Stellaceae bacterium]|nr:spore coat protein U domain-containing protein [Stellaceae bacterium]
MNTRKFVAVACAAALAGVPAAIVPAKAGTATANLSVSTSIAGSCSIGAASMSFPSYAGTLDSASASVTVTCTVATGLSPYITLNTNASGQRNLTNGGSTLAYTLCEDSACGTPITNTTHFPVTYSTTGATNTVYGQIAAGLSGLTGSYSDTATMTLNF